MVAEATEKARCLCPPRLQAPLQHWAQETEGARSPPSVGCGGRYGPGMGQVVLPHTPAIQSSLLWASLVLVLPSLWPREGLAEGFAAVTPRAQGEAEEGVRRVEYTVVWGGWVTPWEGNQDILWSDLCLDDREQHQPGKC